MKRSPRKSKSKNSQKLGKYMKISKILFGFKLFFLLIAAQISSAQTTISNIPSTDIIESKDFYIEVNHAGHFAKFVDGGFQAYGLKTIYGVHKDFEIGANFCFTRNNGISPVEIVPNFKWKVYKNEKNKVAVSGGAMIFVPIREEKGTQPSAFVYSNLSKSFNFANNFRLTSGVYTVVGAKSISGNKHGVMLGYEQNIAKGVSFFADWTSGKNRFGYAAAGLSIPVKKNGVIYTGYNFGNTGRGNNLFSISYGKFF